MTEVVRESGGEAARTLQPQATPKMKTAKARGLGRTYQRGETWWVQYYHRGKLCRESSGSERESDANKLLKRRFAEMGQGRLVGPDVERTTFEDLAEMLVNDYLVNGRRSLDRAQRSIHHLKGFFGRSRAMDVTPDRVSKYICARLETARPATVRLELAALGRMFALGFRAGKVSHRPYFPSIEVRNTRSGFFEEAELQAVLEQLPADLRVLIEFVALTGWRIGEARPLTWRQVDLDAGTVRLEPGSTKNLVGRTWPISSLPRLEALLRAQREHTSAIERERGWIIPWVFHRRGKPIRSVHGAWRRACAQADVPGRLIHDLRRTAVRRFERAGVPRSVAMKLTGHLTESVYKRYAIVSEADLAEGVRKVAVLSAGGPEAPAHRVVRLPNVPEPRTGTVQARSAMEARDAGPASDV